MKIIGRNPCAPAAKPAVPTLGSLDRGATFCRKGKNALYVKADPTDRDVQSYLIGRGLSTARYGAAFTLGKGRLNAYLLSIEVEPVNATVSINR